VLSDSFFVDEILFKRKLCMTYHRLALCSFRKPRAFEMDDLYEVTVGLLQLRQVYTNTITGTVVVLVSYRQRNCVLDLYSSILCVYVCAGLCVRSHLCVHTRVFLPISVWTILPNMNVVPSENTPTP
jgi:hypothetical protein